MNDVLESLLARVETEQSSPRNVSSYWKHYGSLTEVKRVHGRLVLRAAGMDPVRPQGPVELMVRGLERWSYRRVTARYRHFPKVWREALGLIRTLGLGATYNAFKLSSALSLLADHWEEHSLKPRTFYLIGDGDGFLGALIRRFVPGARLYCIDLAKMLVFQANTHMRAEPRARFTAVTGGAKTDPAAEIHFVSPDEADSLTEAFDCAINIASMQEMNHESIVRYFHLLRRTGSRDHRFYCVNRVEKTLPGGEVIRFHEYPWRGQDQVFMDGPCPYYAHFYSRQTLARGPRWGPWGFRVPFVNYFDGEMVHRLASLAPLP